MQRVARFGRMFRRHPRRRTPSAGASPVGIDKRISLCSGASSPVACGVELLEGRVMLSNDQPVVGVNIGGLKHYQPDWVFTDAFKQASDWYWDWVDPTTHVKQDDELATETADLDSKGWPKSLKTKQLPNGATVQQELKSYIYKDFGGHFPVGTYQATWEGDADVTFGEDAITTSSTPNSATFRVDNPKTGITIRVKRINAGPNQTNYLKNLRIWVPDWTDPQGVTHHFQHTPWAPGASFSPFHSAFLQRLQPFNNLRLMEWGATNRPAYTTFAGRRPYDYYTQAAAKGDKDMGVAYEYWTELANELDKDIWVCIPHTYGQDTNYTVTDDPDVRSMAQFFHDNLETGRKIVLEWSNEIWNYDFDAFDWLNQEKNKVPGEDEYDVAARYIKRDFGTWSSVFSDGPGRLTRVIAGKAAGPEVLTRLLSELHGLGDPYDAVACGGYMGGTPSSNTLKAKELAQYVFNAVPGTIARVQWNMDVRDQYASEKPFFIYEGGQGLKKGSLNQVEFIASQTDPIMGKAYRNLMQGLSEVGLDLFSQFTFAGSWDGNFAYGALRWMDQTDSPKYNTLVDPNLYATEFRVEAIQPVATESNGRAATFRIWRSGHLAAGASVPVTFSFGGTAVKGTDYTASATTLSFTSNDQYKDVTITPIGDALSEQDETVTLTLIDGPSYDIDPDLGSASARVVDDDDGWTRVPLAIPDADFEAATITGGGWATSNFKTDSAGKEVPPDADASAPSWTPVSNPTGNEVYHAPTFGQGGTGKFAWASGSGGRTDNQEVQYMSQRINVSAQMAQIDAGTARILATAWVAGGGYGADNGRIRVRFLNGSGVDLGGSQDGKAVTSFKAWLPSVADAAIPIGTRTVEIVLRGQSLKTDLNQNVGFDSVSAVIRYPGGGGGGTQLPAVSVVATDAAAAEAGANPGTFTFSRSGAATAALTINYSVTGSAASGSDYNASPALGTSISFLAGETSKTVTITPIDDSVAGEGDEQVTVTLSANANYTIGQNAATVTIADNDTPPTGPIVANFTNGTGFTSADQYRGIAGQGWLEGWGLLSYNDRIVMSGDQTQTASPLNGGGTYLTAPLVPNSTGTDVRTATMYRSYASTTGVDTSKPYRIEFDYRLDSSTATFTTLEDRINLFGDGQALYGTGPTNTWSVVALGAAGFGARARTFAFGTGNWTQGTAGNQLVDTGVALVQNAVYHITIDNDPAAHQYKATITSGASTFTSGALAWRPSAGNFAAATPTYLHYGAHVDGATEGLTFSLDSVRIAPAGQTQTLAPTDDAHVVGGAFAPNNNGTATDLVVKYNASFDDQKKEAYLKFNTSSITGTLNSVKLMLYGRIGDTSVMNVPVSAYAVSNTTWTEGTLTWNNKPASAGAALATVTVADNVSRRYEFDLTKYVQDQRRLGNNVFSIVLKTAQQTNPSIFFSAKETTGTSFDPQLLVQTGSSTTGTARAAQDALVTAGTSSGQNFGTLTDLRVKLNNTSPELTRNSYLTFDMTTLPDGVLGSVKLRLCGQLNGTGSTNVPLSVYGVADTTWSETALTWDTRPLPDPTALDTETMIDDAERWYEWDVTAYVNQQRAAGKTLVSFALAADDESIPYALFCSREAAANGPELVGTASTGTSVSPTNDARVNAGASSGTNYGQAPDLIVKQNAAFPDQTRESYLTFDTTGVAGTLQSVKLRLNGRMEDTRAGNVVVSAYGVSDTSWNEDSLTWDTKPASGTTALASATVQDDVSRWYEWDLTAYVNQERAAGRTVVSIVLKTATETPNKILFNSGEAAADRPELVIIA